MNLQYSKCTNEKLKKIYGHGDCAAFADILNWKLNSENINSKIIMAGTKIQNHFYIKAEYNNNIYYCDIYGIFKTEKEILNRYGFEKEETYEVKNPDDNDTFMTLVRLSSIYENIMDEEEEVIEEEEWIEEEREELFFNKMLEIYNEWNNSLLENKKNTIIKVNKNKYSNNKNI